jgi:hypothetical protein
LPVGSSQCTQTAYLHHLSATLVAGVGSSSSARSCLLLH